MITILKDMTRKLPTLVIGLSLVVFFGVGCSLDSNGVGPVSETQSTDASSYNSSTLPDIVLPDGLELVSTGEMVIPESYGTLDGDGNGNNPHADLCSSEWITVADGGSVNYYYTGCAIEPGVMPYDAEVTACLPNPGYCIVDFGPHPLFFNGTVDIWFDISNINVPPQMFDRLEMWYVNGNDFEPVPLEIDLENMRAVGQTSHFSRYILTISTRTY